MMYSGEPWSPMMSLLATARAVPSAVDAERDLRVVLDELRDRRRSVTGAPPPSSETATMVCLLWS